MIQLHIESVIIDDSACLVQIRTDRDLRHNVLIAVKAEHLHSFACQPMPDIVGSGKGIAENGITLRQVRSIDTDKGRTCCSVAVTGDEQDRVLF